MTTTTTVDWIVLWLVILTAPAQTAFVLIYGLGSPWYRSLLGRALFTKALGLALVVDLILVYRAFGDDYFARDAVRIGVFGLLLIGAWLQLVALLREKWAGRREDSNRFDQPDLPRHH